MNDAHEYFESFVYELQTGIGGVRVVRGLQVGRLVVRYTAASEFAVDPQGKRGPMLAWTIEHWPARVGVSSTRTFEGAMVIADDVNRFSHAADLDAETIPALRAQLGPAMLAWLNWLATSSAVLPYREWRLGTARAA